MDKIKKEKSGRFLSLKFNFACYVIVLLFISWAGIVFIGLGTNALQDKYDALYSQKTAVSSTEFFPDKSGAGFSSTIMTYEYQWKHPYNKIIYSLIAQSQFIVMPAWVLLCISMTGSLFYKRNLKKPFALLMEASDKIADNNLDFTISYPKNNELGKLCGSFERMRLSLCQNNKEMWRSLEERKRLNSAFIHDLRTPLTVLRGYTDFLVKYIPEGKISEVKLLEVTKTMEYNVLRLERYTQNMYSLQSLESLEPVPKSIDPAPFMKELEKTGAALCSGKAFSFKAHINRLCLFLDEDLIFQVYENLLSNALHYTNTAVTAECLLENDYLTLHITDDGAGFSETALAFATQPFYRETRGEPEKENGPHFGLGLYICRLLCEKHGGSLKISNLSNGGGSAAAVFKV